MMKFLVVILYFEVYYYVRSEDAGYCRLTNMYCPPRAHILCEESGVNVCQSENATSHKKSSNKDNILKALNAKRNLIALGRQTDEEPDGLPPASNMMRLYWDTELDMMVKKAGMMCEDRPLSTYDTDVCFNVERFPVTVLEAKIKDGDIDEGIDSWVETGENLTMKYGALDFYWYDITGVLKDWGPFASFAYAKAYKTACFLNDTYVACLIAPSKTNGQPIYWGGTPCSNCPFNTACQPASDYPQLCSRDDVLFEEDDDASQDEDDEDEEFESEDLAVLHDPSVLLTLGGVFLLAILQKFFDWARV